MTKLASICLISGTAFGVVVSQVAGLFAPLPEAHNQASICANSTLGKAPLWLGSPDTVKYSKPQTVDSDFNSNQQMAKQKLAVVNLANINRLTSPEIIMAKIEALKSQMVEQLKASLRDTNDLNEILTLIDDIMLIDEQAITDEQTNQLINVVIAAYDQPLTDR
ncbi:MAG: hypothetical protein MJK04_01840, partial [Psychrosphaera sp.]|nr:hypothetical protein [Psychrosphaera sp.]